MRFFRKIFTFLVDAVEGFVILGAIFVIVYLFFLQPHQVIGESMSPNFHDSEYLLTDKVSYNFRLPQRGEVIIFKAPGNTEKDYIKRIIGLPGERVKIENGRVFINGQLLDENDYLTDRIMTLTSGPAVEDGLDYEIPPNSYFVMGDNRGNSSDSREFGAIRKSTIIGRSFLTYWPLPIKLLKAGKSS